MNRIFVPFFIFFALIGMTHVVHADIVINEIAWMGTANSSFEEWIELYNSGSDPVSLSGWKLIKSGDVTLFNLSQSIEPGQYLLVCRSVSSAPNPLGGSCNEKGTFGGSGLNNENEVLILKNKEGATVESITSGPKWKTIGGNATTKETAQKTANGSWITASATPGDTNATSSGSSGENPDDPESEENGEVVINSDTKTDPYEDFIKSIEPDPKYSARMITPDIFVQQVPLEFTTLVKKDSVLTDIRGRFEWTMGDGSSFVFRRSTPFTHTYTEPGEYVISLRYYSDVFKEKPDTLHQKTITVIPAQVIVTRNLTGSISIKNTSTDTLDLGSWKIIQDGNLFIFPQYTLVKKGGEITVPYHVHKLSGKTSLLVITPTGYVASTVKNTSGVNRTATNPTITFPDSVVIDESMENLYVQPQKNIIISPDDKQPLNPWIVLFGLLAVIGSTVVFIVTENKDADKDIAL